MYYNHFQELSPNSLYFSLNQGSLPVDQTKDNKMTSEIVLESFSNPTHTWKTMNDPVMGGKSHSSFYIDENQKGILDGEVVDVPFLHAPGFITVRGNGNYPDVSSCTSLVLKAKTNETYGGYRISFGNRHVRGNRYARGYKANFHIQPYNESIVGSTTSLEEENDDSVNNNNSNSTKSLDDGIMEEINIPFSNFTVRWSDLTGDPIVSCQENPNFCPDPKTLRNMKTISIWGEGVAGNIHLEIDSIKAIGCSDTNSYMLGLMKDRSNNGVSSRYDAGLIGFLGFVSSFGIIFGGVYLIVKKVVLSKRRGYANPNENADNSF